MRIVRCSSRLLGRGGGVSAFVYRVSKLDFLKAKCFVTHIDLKWKLWTMILVVDLDSSCGPWFWLLTLIPVVDHDSSCGPWFRFWTLIQVVDLDSGCGPRFQLWTSIPVVDHDSGWGPSLTTNKWMKKVNLVFYGNLAYYQRESWRVPNSSFRYTSLIPNLRKKSKKKRLKWSVEISHVLCLSGTTSKGCLRVGYFSTFLQIFGSNCKIPITEEIQELFQHSLLKLHCQSG